MSTPLRSVISSIRKSLEAKGFADLQARGTRLSLDELLVYASEYYPDMSFKEFFVLAEASGTPRPGTIHSLDVNGPTDTKVCNTGVKGDRTWPKDVQCPSVPVRNLSDGEQK